MSSLRLATQIFIPLKNKIMHPKEPITFFFHLQFFAELILYIIILTTVKAVFHYLESLKIVLNKIHI